MKYLLIALLAVGCRSNPVPEVSTYDTTIFGPGRWHTGKLDSTQTYHLKWHQSYTTDGKDTTWYMKDGKKIN